MSKEQFTLLLVQIILIALQIFIIFLNFVYTNRNSIKQFQHKVDYKEFETKIFNNTNIIFNYFKELDKESLLFLRSPTKSEEDFEKLSDKLESICKSFKLEMITSFAFSNSELITKMEAKFDEIFDDYTKILTNYDVQDSDLLIDKLSIFKKEIFQFIRSDINIYKPIYLEPNLFESENLNQIIKIISIFLIYFLLIIYISFSYCFR